MSDYKSYFQRIASDPWKAFNDAIKKRDAAGETWDSNLTLGEAIEKQENKALEFGDENECSNSQYNSYCKQDQARGNVSEPETSGSHSTFNPYLEEDECSESQFDPYYEQPSYNSGIGYCGPQVNPYCDQYNGSDAGSSDYGDNDAKSQPTKEEESDAEEPESEESIYLDEGPDDYITGLFDIKNTNPAVEDAIAYVDYTGVSRPCLEHETIMNELLDKQREEYYNPPPPPAEGEEPKVSELPGHVPAYNPLYDEIRAKRAKKTLEFGNTRVIRFKASHPVVEDGSKVAKDKLPGKSILKKSDRFVTPNHDDELVGKDEVTLAIARLFNLCDMPLEFLVKNQPLGSLENLVTGVKTAFKTQELCWSRMCEEALRVRDEALNQHNKSMEALTLEKDSLATEVAELRQKDFENEREGEIEARENLENKRLVEEMKQDLKKIITEVEGKNLDLLQANSTMGVLSAENDKLREELRKCRESAEGHKMKRAPLLSKIKQLETKLINEQICAVENEHKIASLRRYREESSVLQQRIDVLENSNRKLVWDNNKLQEENDTLLCKMELLKTSLATTVQDSKASKQREAHVAEANQRLVKQLDESYAHIRRLVDTNTAYKAKFRLRYEEIKRKYAQVSTDCNNRRNEIEKTKLEMEKVGEALKETREKMEREREENTVRICSESMVVHEAPTNVQPVENKHVKGHHRLFRSLANRLYPTPPVINVGEV